MLHPVVTIKILQKQIGFESFARAEQNEGSWLCELYSNLDSFEFNCVVKLSRLCM